MAVSKNLLATSATLDSIRKAVSDFYCGLDVALQPVDDSTWKIARALDSKVLDGVIVLRRKNRYRFEMV